MKRDRSDVLFGIWLLAILVFIVGSLVLMTRPEQRTVIRYQPYGGFHPDRHCEWDEVYVVRSGVCTDPRWVLEVYFPALNDE